MRRFLKAESEQAGWRFWVLWVLATNLAFFPGLAAGQLLTQHTPEPFASGLVGLSFAAPVGVAQWWVLERHIENAGSWALASAAGWGLAGFIGAAALLAIAPGITPGGLVWVLAIGTLGGAMVGLGQLPLMRRAYPAIAPWWILVSAVAWGIFFPGALTGLFLIRSPALRSV